MWLIFNKILDLLFINKSIWEFILQIWKILTRTVAQNKRWLKTNGSDEQISVCVNFAELALWICVKWGVFGPINVLARKMLLVHCSAVAGNWMHTRMDCVVCVFFNRLAGICCHLCFGWIRYSVGVAPICQSGTSLFLQLITCPELYENTNILKGKYTALVNFSEVMCNQEYTTENTSLGRARIILSSPEQWPSNVQVDYFYGNIISCRIPAQ